VRDVVARYTVAGVAPDLADLQAAVGGPIEPTAVHELSYVCLRMPGFPDRQAVHEYIQAFLRLDAVLADDKQSLVETVALWASSNVGFVDTRLRILAGRRQLPVCSANRSDLADLENSVFAADG